MKIKKEKIFLLTVSQILKVFSVKWNLSVILVGWSDWFLIFRTTTPQSSSDSQAESLKSISEYSDESVESKDVLRLL